MRSILLPASIMFALSFSTVACGGQKDDDESCQNVTKDFAASEQLIVTALAKAGVNEPPIVDGVANPKAFEKGALRGDGWRAFADLQLSIPNAISACKRDDKRSAKAAIEAEANDEARFNRLRTIWASAK